MKKHLRFYTRLFAILFFASLETYGQPFPLCNDLH